MTSKKLRNIGFLSHSILPKVDGELQPIVDDRASKTLAKWKLGGTIGNESKARYGSVKSSPKKVTNRSDRSRVINIKPI